MSTAIQVKGDSLRRQLEASEDYARNNGLTIDTSLSFKDIGLSAFFGDHIEKGGFGKFLTAVKGGQVEKGSYLIVESLDRLSRQKVRVALQMFLDLLNNGINIVTLMDNRTYTPENTDAMELMMSLAVMSRAYDESLTKSTRGLAAWKNKRHNAHNRVLTSKCVAWLVPKPDRKGFDLIPKRVAVVQRVFSEAADQGMGVDLIARRLTKERIPTFGNSKAWQKSYIQRILASRAVLGEYLPREGRDEPISNYYPPIIAEDMFYRAQSARQMRRLAPVKGRKGDGVANLFSGLLRCGTCSGSIHIISKGANRWRMLTCANVKKGISTDCYRGGWNYHDFEVSFLNFVREIDLATIGLRPDNVEVRIADAIRETEGKLVEAKAQLDRAFALVLDNSTDFLKRKVADLDTTVGRFESELAELKAQQTSLTQRSQSFEEGKSGLSELVKKFKAGTDDAFSLRSTLAFHLRSIINEIRIFPGGDKVKQEITNIGEQQLFPGTVVQEKWWYKDELLPMSPASRYFVVKFKNSTFRYVRPAPNDPTQLYQMMATGEELLSDGGARIWKVRGSWD